MLQNHISESGETKPCAAGKQAASGARSVCQRGEMMSQTGNHILPEGVGAHRAKYLLITSCKGGVGKSTCAANIAAALARRGRRVLLCDCDFDMRCLDLLLGLENDVVYDLYDAAAGRVPVAKAIISDERFEGRLGFIAAPYSGGGELSPGMLRSVFTAAESVGGYEYVLIDTPGSLASPAILDTGLIGTAVIVASHQPSSIRAADRTGEYLSGRRIKEQRLLINCFDFDGALSGARPGINEIIDRTFIQLCGIVPYDRGLMLASEKGEPGAGGNPAAAFDNIACRLLGRYVPLFAGFRGISVRRKIKRLLV